MDENSAAQIVLIMYLSKDTLFKVAFADRALDQDNLLKWMLTDVKLVIAERILTVLRLDYRSEIPFP